MNKRQNNKLNSYQSVKGVLEDNRPIYESVNIINQSVDSFFKVVDEVDTMEVRGGVKSGSVAETRRLVILYRVADDLLAKKLERPDVPGVFFHNA